MTFFDNLFNREKKPEIVRGQRSPFMNLAYGILPVAEDVTPSAWDTPPAPLAHLTDENPGTHLDTPGVHDDADQTYIRIDLGQVYEVYEIIVSSYGTTGFNKAVAGADVDVHIETSLTNDVTAAVTRDTQTVTGDGADHASTLHYVGNGIAARYVYVEFTGEVGDILTVDLTEITVYGC